MSRRRAAWFMAMAVLTLLAAYSAPAFPMTAEDPAEVTQGSGQEATPSSEVERILEQQEQMLRGQQFSYEPSGRRDPFLSLYDEVDPQEERPRGVAGMLVNEIDLMTVDFIDEFAETNRGFDRRASLPAGEDPASSPQRGAA